MCPIVKDVCQAIVELLLPKYIQVPTGNRLQVIVNGFESRPGGVFHNVLEQLMAHTSPLLLHRSTQPTTTIGKAGTPLSYKE